MPGKEPAKINRREFLGSAAAAAATIAIGRPLWAAGKPQSPLIRKTIPKSGEEIPAIGMGTWQTFDVGTRARELKVRTEILRAFFAGGGGMIDSSPMYGSSEEVVGRCLKELDASKGLFSATKVWTPMMLSGVKQIENSFSLWGLERIDLYQVHNLVDWEEHLETLRALKAEGRVRYVGVTTSHGRRHEKLAQILKSQELDFVQLTYNIRHREVEQRLLPLARERGVAVIANRPYDYGSLPDSLEGKPLPPWAAQAGMKNWPEFLLKFIISHPAITCAIPATSQVAHMRENMAACRGELPDAKTRERMVRYFESL